MPCKVNGDEQTFLVQGGSGCASVRTPHFCPGASVTLFCALILCPLTHVCMAMVETASRPGSSVSAVETLLVQ